MLCRFSVAQQDGEHRKQMDAFLDIQGHGAPAAELLQQVALLSPGQLAIKHGRTSVFPSVGVYVRK